MAIHDKRADMVQKGYQTRVEASSIGDLARSQIGASSSSQYSALESPVSEAGPESNSPATFRKARMALRGHTALAAATEEQDEQFAICFGRWHLCSTACGHAG